MSVNSINSIYKSRFTRDSIWKRILFRPDRKSQAAEFNELQQLLNSQQGDCFYSLYGPFYVVKGLKIKVNSLSPVYKLEVENGRVFVSNSMGAYFIDIDSFLFTVPTTGRSIISILPSFNIKGDECEELRDPVTGGQFSGDYGAHRLAINYQININGDGYPLFIIDGQGNNNYPVIYYYVDDYFTTQYREFITPPFLSNELEKITREEYGDYIAEGLYANVTSNNYLSISPGVAYIKGKRIDKVYGFGYVLPFLYGADLNKVIGVYLSETGLFNVIEQNINQVTTVPNSIKLCDVYIRPHPRFNSLRTYVIVGNDNRAISNAELLFLQETVLDNQKFMLSESLKRQEIDDSLIRDINIAGTLVETFTFESGSSTFHPLYNAEIKEGKLQVASNINSLRLSDLTVSSSNNALFQNSSFSNYISTSFAESLLINQTRASEFIELNPQTNNPSIGINPLSSIPLEDRTLSVETVTLIGGGFLPLEDNLSLAFGDKTITLFVPANGTTLGTAAYSFRASASGTINLSFLIPADLPAKSYPITVSNSRVSTSFVYSYSDSTFQVNETYRNTYLLAGSSVAQTFYIDTPMVINAVSIAIRRFNDLLTDRNEVCTLYLVKATEERPGTEVISKCSLPASAVILSSNGSGFSKVVFDIPAVIDTVGHYALVVSTSNSGLQLYTASVGEADLITGSVSENQPLINGSLVVNSNGNWSSILSTDLTFKLYQAIPSALLSSITLNTSNPIENINNIALSLVSVSKKNTVISVLGNTNTNSSTFLPLPALEQVNYSTNSFDIRFNLRGSSFLFPIIDSKSSYITTYSNSTSAIWVSRNYFYSRGYRNIEVIVDYYLPRGAKLFILLSSNKSQTWEALTLEGEPDDLIVNGNIPIYRSLYYSYNLTEYVSVTDLNDNTALLLRKDLSIRIDLEANTSGQSPYVEQFTLKVY